MPICSYCRLTIAKQDFYTHFGRYLNYIVRLVFTKVLKRRVKMSTKRQNPETIVLHGGDYRSDPTTKAVAVPIYRTTSYLFDSTEHAANLFSLQ